MKEAAGYIPLDISADILSRLPAKSLLRFKSVSKSWYSLISDPYFIDSHSKQSSRNPKLLFNVKTRLNEELFSQFQLLDPENLNPDDFRASSLTSPREIAHSFILGSSNGLVCVANFSQFCRGLACAIDRISCRSSLYLWNPFTREVQKIPDLSPPVLLHHAAHHSFAHGFCYDPVSNDYKVVLWRFGLACHVFSMNSNSWKSIACPAEIAGVCVHLEATVINGVIYWRVAWPFGYCFEIVAFDSREERFLELHIPRMPRFASKGIFHMCLLEHNGCLCFSFGHVVGRKYIEEIWMWKEHGWVHLVNISLKYTSNVPNPIYISWSGTRVMFHNRNHILRKAGEEDGYDDIEICGSAHNIYEAAECIETLISPIRRRKRKRSC